MHVCMYAHACVEVGGMRCMYVRRGIIYILVE